MKQEGLTVVRHVSGSVQAVEQSHARACARIAAAIAVRVAEPGSSFTGWFSEIANHVTLGLVLGMAAFCMPKPE